MFSRIRNLLIFRRGEIIVSPVIVSRMLSRVTLRRELRAVFDDLAGLRRYHYGDSGS